MYQKEPSTNTTHLGAPFTNMYMKPVIEQPTHKNRGSSPKDMPDFVISLGSFGDVTPEELLLGSYMKVTPDGTEERASMEDIKSSQEREKAIVNDLLYVLDGSEGDYIKFDRHIDIENPHQKLKGIPYDNDAHLDINLREIATQLTALGIKVSSLKYAATYFNRPCYGKVAGKFCHYIRNFLNEYRRKLCTMREASQSIVGMSIIQLSQAINNSYFEPSFGTFSECICHLFEVSQSLIKEDQKRLKQTNLTDMRFESLMNSIKEDASSNQLDDIVTDSQNSKYVNGGIILNVIHSEIIRQKGNETSSQFLKHLYDFVSTDYLTIMNEWLQSGKISDVFHEFFILEDTTLPTSYNCYHWMNKFAIKRECLLTQFKSAEYQKKIFLTGKYLAILRACKCEHLVREKPFDPIKSLNDVNVNVAINEAYKRANVLFAAVLYENYGLQEFMELLNKCFLLSDGSCFDNFLNHSNHELKRSYHNTSTLEISKLYYDAYEIANGSIVQQLMSEILKVEFQRHSILEDIVEIIKTHITNFDEIMNVSNIGSLTEILKANVNTNTAPSSSSSDGETQRCNKLAISRLSLEINIPFPINQIVVDSQKLEYQILFRHSALLKFLEKRMEKSWRELGYHAFWTWTYEDRRIQKWIKKCRFIHTKMFDFLRVYSYYLKHDVLETNWSNVDQLAGISDGKFETFDITAYKSQITDFLSSSMCDLLLSRADLANCLYEIFTLILVFHEYVMSLRKALLLMDENLLNSQIARLKLSMNFSASEKEKRLSTIIQVLDSYHITFQKKLLKLCQYLGYYGEIDSPKMLLLHSKLVSSFKL